MNIKKINTTKLIKIFFVLIILATITTINTNQTQAICQASNTACSTAITTPGYGAVELCNDCFICGANDGVCPMYYAAGGETKTIEILLRKGSDRPGMLGADHTITYTTPNEACAQFAGTYKSAKRKSTKTGTWVPDSSITETTQINELNRYILIECENVPKTPSCNDCIDLDCGSEIRGAIYEQGTNNPIRDSTILIRPQLETIRQNTAYERVVVPDAEGKFTIPNAYAGNIQVICSAQGYTPVTKEITAHLGKNLVDCEMTKATCAADCTVPSSNYGERVCSSECHGQNGCNFQNTDYMNACHLKPEGYIHIFNETISGGWVITQGVRCCNTQYDDKKPIFNPELPTTTTTPGGKIANLITRKYNKVLEDGTPVILNIIVYNK